MLRERRRRSACSRSTACCCRARRLSLRVFERRYLDLVRECTRESRGFGVCLILIGDEVGAPATPAKFGTQARIEDFTTGDDGLLHLRIRGGRRFRVDTTHVRDNGLLLADVDWCEHDPDDELRPEHATLGIDARAHPRTGRRRTREGAAGAHSTKRRGSAGVSPNCLPLQESQRQALLQMDDPHARLDWMLRWIELTRLSVRARAAPAATLSGCTARLDASSPRDPARSCACASAVVGDRPPQHEDLAAALSMVQLLRRADPERRAVAATVRGASHRRSTHRIVRADVAPQQQGFRDGRRASAGSTGCCAGVRSSSSRPSVAIHPACGCTRQPRCSRRRCKASRSLRIAGPGAQRRHGAMRFRCAARAGASSRSPTTFRARACAAAARVRVRRAWPRCCAAHATTPRSRTRRRRRARAAASRTNARRAAGTRCPAPAPTRCRTTSPPMTSLSQCAPRYNSAKPSSVVIAPPIR